MLFRLLLAGLLLLLSTLSVSAQGGTMDRAAVVAQATKQMYIQAKAKAAQRALSSVTHDDRGKLIVDSLSGVALYELGNLAYDNSEDSLAVNLLRQAVFVWDSVYLKPHADRAYARTSLIPPLIYTGRLNEALQIGREATAIYELLPQVDTSIWIRALVDMAEPALELRDQQLARSATYRAIDLTQRAHVSDTRAFQTYYHAAEMFLRFDELEEAQHYAQRSLDYAKRLDQPERIMKAYNQLAITEHVLGNSEAERSYLRAGIAVHGSVRGHNEILATLYLNLADYYGERGEYHQSVKYDRIARQLFEAGSFRVYAANAHQAAHLHQMGYGAEGLSLIKDKLAYLVTDSSLTHPKIFAAENPASIIPCIDLLSARAEILTSSGNYPGALRDYAIVVELLDYLRTEVNSFYSRRYLSKTLRPLLDRAISLHYNEYRAKRDPEHLWQAFELSERARAFDLLAEIRTTETGRSTAALQLDGQIAELERRLARGEQEVADELATARLSLDVLTEQEHLLPTKTFRLDRAALLAYLADQQRTLVEYNLGDSLGLAFVLTPEGKLSAYEIDDLATLNDRITRWRRSIEEGKYRRKSLRPTRLQDSLDEVFLSLGSELARVLLPTLDASHPRPRLIIVPDGGLHYLPFAALPVAERTQRPLNYRKVAYLQDRVELSHAYSASVLLEVATQELRPYAHQLVAFAPTFAEEGDDGLPPLVYNAQEVTGLQGLRPQARVYAAGEATRTNFNRQLGQSAILHLSSHGSVDPQDANLSFVAFTQVGDSTDRNERLYFNDLRHMHLNNELTVLSACETSLGELAVGETTLSFGSALAAAGSRTTVTTLWKVDDGATKDLLLSFYRRVFEGTQLARSLNEAQSELRNSRDYAHPYYWSGVVLYGNPAALPDAVLTLEGPDDHQAATAGVLLSWRGWSTVTLLLAGMLVWFLRFLYKTRAGSS